ncbi:MAG: translocation/assembly module TamB domain-containing protein [Spongiibacteraceae bacterium]|jgi:translocation and assembly module TamB|nr:translocation/assembly module TamB domain-containing protein [Spongiibacteraceae bacterium]
MKRSTLRRAGLVVTVVVGLVVLGGGWLVGTTSGTAWSLQLAARWVPGLVLDGVSGSWQQGIAIDQVSYAQSDGVVVTVDALQLGLELRRGRRLRLEPLSAQAVRVAVPLATKTKEESSERELPAMTLPLRLTVPALAVDRLTVVTGETEVVIDDIRAALSWAGSRAGWRDLSLRYQTTALSSDGNIQLRDAYPLDLQLQLQHGESDAATPLTARLDARGALDALLIDAQLQQPWQLTATAEINLLDPALPLRLDGTLTAPMALPGDLELAAAAVHAAGTRDALEGELSATVDLPRYPASIIAMPFQWDGTTLTFSPAAALGDAQGQLQAACTTTPLSGTTGSCTGALQSVDVTPWLPTRGRIASDFAVQLDALEPLQLNASLTELDGTIGGKPLAGELTVAIDGNRWRLGDSRLRAGANQLRLSGGLGGDAALTFRLELPEPQLLLPGASGSLTLDGTARGEPAALSAEAHLEGERLTFGATQIGALHATISIDELGRQTSRVQLEAKQLAQGAVTLDAASLTLDGTLGNHQLSLDLHGLAELAVIRLGCDGRTDDAFSQLRLNCADWLTLIELDGDGWRWQLRQPLQLAWERTAQQLRLEPFCLESPEGSVCLTLPLRWTDGILSPLRLASDGIDLRRVTALLPAGVTLQQSPQLAFAIDLRQLEPLDLTASASLSPTVWQWQTEEGNQQTLLDTLLLDLRADSRRAVLTAATSSPATGRFDAALTVQEPLGRRALHGHVALTALQMDAFQWLAPQFDPTGRIDIDLRFGGSMSTPTLAGQARLTEGSARIEAIGQPLEQVTLLARFDQQAADFSGSLMLGPGRARLAGQLVWDDPAQWQLSAQLSGEHLQIQPLPDSTVAFSPVLRIAATPARVDITGEVAIPLAALHIEELPPSAARVSPDAEWVGAAAEETTPAQLFADVGLRLGDDVHFRGFGADVWLTGGMRLRHNPSQGVRATGEVQVSRGRYRAYGQRLIIRRGSFLFTGPLENPELNLEAIREMPPTDDDQVVGIRVLGPLRNPNAELFAEPSMAESDIAYWLLTGRAPPEAGATQQVSAAGALLSLGVAGSGDQTARLAERFGIRDFQVSTYETETGTQAAVSGYLSPRLYVRYGAGLRDGTNTIAFQYRLTSKLVLEAVSGLEEALDLLYSFTID